jgi:hypothetical protein
MNSAEIKRAGANPVIGSQRAVQRQGDKAGMIVYLLRQGRKTMAVGVCGEQHRFVSEPPADRRNDPSPKRIDGDDNHLPARSQRKQWQILAVPEYRENLMTFRNISVKPVQLDRILAQQHAPTP